MRELKLIVAISLALVDLGTGTANAGSTVEEAGALVCVTDKWDEKEPEKGHKLVDAVMRCVAVPDDASQPRTRRTAQPNTNTCPTKVGRAREAASTPTRAATRNSRLGKRDRTSRNIRKITGGTGKYQGASGGGTYMYENLTDTLCGGRYKGKMVLP